MEIHFVQRRLQDAQISYLPPDITDLEELKNQHDMFITLKRKNIPKRNEEATLQTLLERINELEGNMINTIRGRRNVRGQQRHPRRGSRSAGIARGTAKTTSTAQIRTTKAAHTYEGRAQFLRGQAHWGRRRHKGFQLFPHDKLQYQSHLQDQE